MKRRNHPFLALFFAGLLLFAEQAAVAHLIGHAGAAAEEVAQSNDDVAHMASLSLSHLCTTCLAFAAMDAAPPLSCLSLPGVSAPPPTLLPVLTPIAARFESRYRSRAPPALA